MDIKQDILIKGAMQLFKNLGIKSVSMDDIARELKISKKTLYIYFKNKTDLIANILLYINDSELEYFNSNYNLNIKNAIDELLYVSKWVGENFRNLKPAHIYDLKKYYSETFEAFWEIKQKRIFEFIKSNLKRGIEEGIYRAEMKIEIIAALYASNLENYNSFNNRYLGEYGFDDIFKISFENHLRIICNEKGLHYYNEIKNEFY
ncbi:MAG: TetR/AcrR family transcriptional regulator [Bacteroidales bacterium]|nr:TetR/AcrR family transcriptional regulator [Bacteroidales bacterium]